MGEILQASQRLAHAQSERQATACRLLPPIHWALLYTIGSLFVSTFILFETGGSFSNEGRHILFTVLCGLMTFVLVVSPLRCLVRLPRVDSYWSSSSLLSHLWCTLIVHLVTVFLRHAIHHANAWPSASTLQGVLLHHHCNTTRREDAHLTRRSTLAPT